MYLFREQSHLGRVIVAHKKHVSEITELTSEERAVYQEVCVLGEGLGSLALGANIHYIVNNALGQTVGDVVVADDLTSLLKGGLVGSHRSALVVFV